MIQPVGELLNNYVHFITKQMQTVADFIFGADTDNSNEPIPMQNIFCCECIGLWNSMLADNFDTYWWGNGHWSLLYSYNINYANGVLTYSGFNQIGRYKKSVWDQIVPYMGDTPNADEGDRLLSEYINSHEQYYPEKRLYPDEAVYPSYTIDGITGKTKITFYQKPGGIDDSSGLYSSYPAYNGLRSSQYINIQYNDITITAEATDGYYTADNDPPEITTSYNAAGFKRGMLITNMQDQTVINNYVTNNAADNNYNYSFETNEGDTVEVYYGDNYIIFKNDPETEVSYNELYNELKKITKVINTDTGSNIKVPTYNDNKGIEDPDADKEVDMPINEAVFGAGLTHYYVCNKGAGVLDDISAAMSTWDINNTGKDLYKNLLSCRLTKIGSIPAEASTFVIYGEELQYNGSPITINKVTGNPTIDLGEYEIQPKFNDFRDYAPYTKAEIYIPYCGWLALPSHVMSSEDNPKIISGTIITDIIAATCKAIIKCNDTVIGEAAGVTAIDIPFVGENVGMKMAGIANSMISYGKSAASGIGGVLSGAKAGSAAAGAAAAGGLVGIAGSLAQVAMAENANFTEICGKTGDGCQIGGLGSVYIKIQRPKTGGFEEPDFVPEDYAHTTGFLCMKKRLISDCTGLIICNNVDTSGISGATERERAEIKRLLETGVIVEHPAE